MDEWSFLQFGAGAAAAGGAVYYLREIPKQLWAFCKRQMIVSLEVDNRDEAFLWLSKWLAEREMLRFSARSYQAIAVRQEDRRKPPVARMIPAPGWHICRWRGRLIIINRAIKDQTMPLSRDGESGMGILPETISLDILGRDSGLAHDLVQEARDMSLGEDAQRLKLWLPQSWGGWEEGGKIFKRSVASVVLADGISETILSDARHFLDSADWYRERGCPWRRSYLLEGPPGNGKTSLVCAVASELDSDICWLPLSLKSLDDGKLAGLMQDLPAPVVVLEDIDCAMNGKGDGSITMSGLLQALCGLPAGDGRIMFMTTNYPEKLDPRLLRPGRSDMRIHIGNAQPEQAAAMFRRWFPQANEIDCARFVSALHPVAERSMAEVQEALIAWDSEKTVGCVNLHIPTPQEREAVRS